MSGQIAASMSTLADQLLAHLATGLVHSLVEGLEVRCHFIQKKDTRSIVEKPLRVWSGNVCLPPRRQGLKLSLDHLQLFVY